MSEQRAVSTALDVALAALVVSGALVVLASVSVGPPPDRGTDAADETATLLGSATRSVNYSLAPGARHADATGVVAFEQTSGPEFRRHDHGTLAALLARAAVANTRIETPSGTAELSRTSEDFERAVVSATRTTVARADAGLQVRAVWRPYPGAPLGGGVAAGDAPPPDAAVHAATVRVPVAVPETRGRALAAADDGYGAVARVVARGVVRGLFEPDRAWLALRGDRPVSALATYRYRRAATLLDVAIEEPLSRYDVTTVNERLTAALASELAADLRERFGSPRAAAERVSTGTATVTVRTWSR